VTPVRAPPSGSAAFSAASAVPAVATTATAAVTPLITRVSMAATVAQTTERMLRSFTSSAATIRGSVTRPSTVDWLPACGRTAAIVVVMRRPSRA
jgi:hypothetical protein